jgi:hypothetical protein
MEQFKEEDYELVPEYKHGITGWWIRWHKILKLSAIKREMNVSPSIRKFQEEDENEQQS